jgi:hypothetical protein
VLRGGYGIFYSQMLQANIFNGRGPDEADAQESVE